MKNEEKTPDFVSASFITKKYSIAAATLRNWANDGSVRCLRKRCGEKVGRRLYDLRSVETAIGVHREETKKDSERHSIIYVRIPPSQEKEDLEQETQRLRQEFPGHAVLTDVGSGLDFKRKGFQTLLERVVQGMVRQVVVSHKDVLCRFGFDLVAFLFEKFGTKLLVHGGPVSGGDRELADDLLAVSAAFVARHNGLCSGKRRKRRKIQAREETTLSIEQGREEESGVGRHERGEQTASDQENGRIEAEI